MVKVEGSETGGARGGRRVGEKRQVRRGGRGEVEEVAMTKKKNKTMEVHGSTQTSTREAGSRAPPALSIALPGHGIPGVDQASQARWGQYRSSGLICRSGCRRRQNQPNTSSRQSNNEDMKAPDQRNLPRQTPGDGRVVVFVLAVGEEQPGGRQAWKPPSPASEGPVNQAQDGSWIVVWIPMGASRLLARYSHRQTTPGLPNSE